MSDILADYRHWRESQPTRIGTHSDRCHMWQGHERCMIHRLARRLEAVTLTDAEREAVTACAEICESQARSASDGQSLDAAERWSQKAATLRGLLERLT